MGWLVCVLDKVEGIRFPWLMGIGVIKVVLWEFCVCVCVTVCLLSLESYEILLEKNMESRMIDWGKRDRDSERYWERQGQKETEGERNRKRLTTRSECKIQLPIRHRNDDDNVQVNAPLPVHNNFRTTIRQIRLRFKFCTCNIKKFYKIWWTVHNCISTPHWKKEAKI